MGVSKPWREEEKREEEKKGEEKVGIEVWVSKRDTVPPGPPMGPIPAQGLGEEGTGGGTPIGLPVL